MFTPFGGPLRLPRLVVHFVYPVWWSIVFTPFGGPLRLPRLVENNIKSARQEIPRSCVANALATQQWLERRRFQTRLRLKGGCKTHLRPNSGRDADS